MIRRRWHILFGELETSRSCGSLPDGRQYGSHSLENFKASSQFNSTQLIRQMGESEQRPSELSKIELYTELNDSWVIAGRNDATEIAWIDNTSGGINGTSRRADTVEVAQRISIIHSVAEIKEFGADLDCPGLQEGETTRHVEKPS